MFTKFIKVFDKEKTKAFNMSVKKDDLGLVHLCGSIYEDALLWHSNVFCGLCSRSKTRMTGNLPELRVIKNPDGRQSYPHHPPIRSTYDVNLKVSHCLFVEILYSQSEGDTTLHQPFIAEG